MSRSKKLTALSVPAINSQFAYLNALILSRTSGAATGAPIASPTFTGTVTIPSGAVLGTPASITLTNATGLPVGAVTGLGAGVATFLGTPAANIADGWLSANVALRNVDNNFSVAQHVSGNFVVTGQVYSIGTTAALIMGDRTNSRLFYASRDLDITNIGGQNTAGTYTWPIIINHNAPDGAITIGSTGIVTLNQLTAGFVKSSAGGLLSVDNSVSATEFGFLTGATSSLQTQINTNTTNIALKAPLASPTFTGTVTAAAITATGKISTTLTTMQQSLNFDASNHLDFTVSSTGIATINAVGSGASVVISPALVAASFQSVAAGVNANLWIPVGSSTSTTTNAQHLFAGATTVRGRIFMRGSSSAIMALSESYANVIIGSTDVTEWTTGAHAMLASLVVNPLTVTAAAATVTDAATVFINGAGNAVTTGRNDALKVSGTVFITGGRLDFETTTTTAGTTGAQTINKPTGTVNIAAAGTSVVVTNSLVSATSLVRAWIRTNDANKSAVYAIVPAAGSFTVFINPAPAAEVSIGFVVNN